MNISARSVINNHALFQGFMSQILVGAITGLPFNQAGIALPNPTQTAEANWTASCVITGHLVAALRGTDEFRSGYHALLMEEVMEEIRRRRAEAAETTLGEARAAASKKDTRRKG